MKPEQFLAAEPIIKSAAQVQEVRKIIEVKAHGGSLDRSPVIIFSTADSSRNCRVSEATLIEAIGPHEYKRIQDMVGMMVRRALDAKEDDLEAQLNKI